MTAIQDAQNKTKVANSQFPDVAAEQAAGQATEVFQQFRQFPTVGAARLAAMIAANRANEACIAAATKHGAAPSPWDSAATAWRGIADGLRNNILP